ncbi:MAG TPA: GNAT family N-acetyltransferase [Candidatus Acidoferrales bacterium]|nr:GNAT family N-acetyltransferase [Candidatus Acidoferrales bacterium]
MAIGVRAAELREIEPLREQYRSEMNCQIIHDSIHERPGRLYDDGTLIGYGSAALAGPWRDNYALYEFFVAPEHRTRPSGVVASLLPVCGAKISSQVLFTFPSGRKAPAFAQPQNLMSLTFSDSNWMKKHAASLP